MDLIFSYIGFSQSLFAILLILTKKPVKIAYYILSILLFDFTLIFGLDILQYYELIPPHRWAISLSIRMMYPPLFFLYSKYITKDYSTFELKDLLHAIPSVSLLVLYFSIKLLPGNHDITNDLFLIKYEWVRQLYGYVFMALIVFYVYYAIYKVISFKRQLKDSYSYHSTKISLDWLLVMILLFVVLLALIIISSALYESGKIDNKVYIFRHILELFHVYVLSFWGFRQNQLISDPKLEETFGDTDHEPESGKYIKSGLTEENAKNYARILVEYMDKTEIWKDPELSIAKLSSKTEISKHQLSEVLNEYMGKNFYIFVNEYRVKYAKKLLTQKEWANWSILAIAYECGFNSKTAFNNFFKKNTQHTPSEFRKEFGIQK